ncbi:hypothetical protein ACWEHA_27565 [Amycolatopsis nivea]
MDESGTQAANEVERVVAETIEDGLDDWVPLDWLITNTARVVPEDSDRFTGFFASVLGYLLREGLMVVGEIGNTGFEPWPPAAVEDTVDRVVRDCQAVNWTPRLGLYWLANTPEGDRRAG